MKTQVAIVGGGPSGLLLSEILFQHGIDSVVLEKRSRDHVLSRIRAGVLTHKTVDLMTRYGLGERLALEAQRHPGFRIAWDGNKSFFIDIAKYTQRYLTTYGQAKIQEDLFRANTNRNGIVFNDVTHVSLRAIHTETPQIIFHHADKEIKLECDYVAGCDGFHGITRQSIPAQALKIHNKAYPFGWLGVLSQSRPLKHITYAQHPRGFALASQRGPMLSRYYIQVPDNTNPNDWSEDRFWNELMTRYPQDIADHIINGKIIEKSFTPLRSSIVEPLRYGNLFLLGDAAHILPPTGAKGLNLAISDVFHFSQAVIHFYQTNKRELLDQYSQTCLKQAWHYSRVAWYLTNLLHTFPESSSFDQQTQHYELSYLHSSDLAQAALAEQYEGLAFEAT